MKTYQKHYDNKNGSLYKLSEELELNSYEFDILKRIVRCRKKGQFADDLQKIKDTCDIYLEEADHIIPVNSDLNPLVDPSVNLKNF